MKISSPSGKSWKSFIVCSAFLLLLAVTPAPGRPSVNHPGDRLPIYAPSMNSTREMLTPISASNHQQNHRLQQESIDVRIRPLESKERHSHKHRHRERKKKRRQRILLKARDKNLIRSDSPGLVITSANVVKKDWCRTIRLKQKITEPGCRTRSVPNHFCYGQCNSFFIPHSGHKAAAFQSCAFCKPSKQRWGNITLNCPGKDPPTVTRTVLFVEGCRCATE